MNTPELRLRIQELKRKLNQIESDADSRDAAAYYRLSGELYDAEAAFALAHGFEAARVVRWKYPWSIGSKACLIREPNSSYLIYTPEQKPSAAPTVAVIALSKCVACRMGPPNDETLQGHRLVGRGLRPYAVHVVENSTWLTEFKMAIYKSFPTDNAYWEEMKHYVFTFKEETLECACHGLDLVAEYPTFQSALADLATKCSLN